MIFEENAAFALCPCWCGETWKADSSVEHGTSGQCERYMASTVTIDLRQVGRGLDIPLRQIQAVVELLDEGNTVPFITRYRKDPTGGLDEEQIREIQGRLAKLRLLADRKQTILRSIDSQGKLTEKLAKQILSATTTKRLEDLYLPYKPKKQTLATAARTRGLEPLAHEILEAAPTCADLDARAADFVSTDRHVPTAADALLGAGHILAEQFSELAELRQRLREVLQRTGVLVCTRIPVDAKPAPETKPAPSPETATQGDSPGSRVEESGSVPLGTTPIGARSGGARDRIAAGRGGIGAGIAAGRVERARGYYGRCDANGPATAAAGPGAAANQSSAAQRRRSVSWPGSRLRSRCRRSGS